MTFVTARGVEPDVAVSINLRLPRSPWSLAVTYKAKEPHEQRQSKTYAIE
jgi:hypothetical protein